MVSICSLRHYIAAGQFATFTRQGQKIAHEIAAIILFCVLCLVVV